MPLNGSLLGTELLTAVQSAASSGQESDGPAAASAIWQAIGIAIVNHIQTNAAVTTTSGAPDGEHIGIIT